MQLAHANMRRVKLQQVPHMHARRLGCARSPCAISLSLSLSLSSLLSLSPLSLSLSRVCDDFNPTVISSRARRIAKRQGNRSKFAQGGWSSLLRRLLLFNISHGRRAELRTAHAVACNIFWIKCRAGHLRHFFGFLKNRKYLFLSTITL